MEAVARAAVTLPVRPNPEVVSRHGMPSAATLLTTKREKAATAPHVLLVRNRLEVLRVHAERVAAQVIEEEPVWDRPDEPLVDDPVSKRSAVASVAVL